MHFASYSTQLLTVTTYCFLQVFSQGWKKVGMIYTTDSYATSGAQATTEALVSMGITVLVSASFNPGETDVSFSMGRLAENLARIIIFW